MLFLFSFLNCLRNFAVEITPLYNEAGITSFELKFLKNETLRKTGC